MAYARIVEKKKNFTVEIKRQIVPVKQNHRNLVKAKVKDTYQEDDMHIQ